MQTTERSQLHPRSGLPGRQDSYRRKMPNSPTRAMAPDLGKSRAMDNSRMLADCSTNAIQMQHGERVYAAFVLGKSSPGRTRTYDPAVNSRLLYQLSYRGSVVVPYFCSESPRLQGLPRRFGGAVDAGGNERREQGCLRCACSSWAGRGLADRRLRRAWRCRTIG